MKVNFNTYLDKKLYQGYHYVKVVNIDEIISLEDVNILTVKFASAEGYFSKEYILNEEGINNLYNDFIYDYYLDLAQPINKNALSSYVVFDFVDSNFDTHKHMLNYDYQIKIELENSHLIAKTIRLINIDYEMALNHNVPYIDRLEDLDEAQRIKDEAESYSNYARNNQSDTFEFGGLSGEEAETLYWNID